MVVGDSFVAGRGPHPTLGGQAPGPAWSCTVMHYAAAARLLNEPLGLYVGDNLLK